MLAVPVPNTTAPFWIVQVRSAAGRSSSEIGNAPKLPLSLSASACAVMSPAGSASTLLTNEPFMNSPSSL